MSRYSGEDFINDIYVNGITPEIIDKNKKHFANINLIIHYSVKFIQANEAVISFGESKNSINGSIYTTVKPFPDDEALNLLCNLKDFFHDMTVYDIHGDSHEKHITDNLNKAGAVESGKPKVCIFYIYAGQVIIDLTTLDDVSIEQKANDYNMNRQHSLFWRNYMIKQYPELSGSSYLSVPRGRVVYGNRVFQIFLDREYFTNAAIRAFIENACCLKRSEDCGYEIKYIESPHYDYRK